MQYTRNWLALSALLVVGILIGSLAGHTGAQQEVRGGAAPVVVYQNRNPQELADTILRLQQANAVSDEQLQEIYDKIFGRAQAGDLHSALIVFRIAEAQRKQK